LNAQVVAPAPELNRTMQRQAPSLQQTVAAPAPEVKAGLQRQVSLAPEPSVIAPPPRMDAASSRRMGDINIGHSDVVAPAPRLPVGEQRAAMATGRTALGGGGGPSVAAPPPSIQGLGTSRGGGGQIIALSVRPAPPNAAAIPAGNRRGTFATTPEGKPGAAGTPEVRAGKEQAGKGVDGRGGSGTGSAKNVNGIPPGIIVGSGSKDSGSSAVAGSSSNTLTASVTPPRVGTASHDPAAVSPENATEMERKVFGDRKFYSMMLNMPNLNSSGGSWVIRFAEMGEDKEKEKGNLNGPVATQTADPAYPMDLMRKNVQGTVTLYAVIHDDGTVGEVRVLDGVNDRLDEYAMTALRRWKFRPATKNGNAVALEAVIRIPFKPFHFKSSF
jgi:TonB family protein